MEVYEKYPVHQHRHTQDRSGCSPFKARCTRRVFTYDKVLEHSDLVPGFH